MKLDNRPDAMMLEGACVNYARAVTADLEVLKHGIYVTDRGYDKDGNLVSEKEKAHPAVAISNAAWRQVRAFCSEFGLSPVSRTRLAVEKKTAPEEDLAKLLSQPRPPRASVQ
jgi:P27 family predicted phage terminase small subunit